MRKALVLFLLLPILFGCKKEKLNAIYNIQFQNSSSNQKHQWDGDAKDEDTLYTQFGDYITSITPSVFTAKFQTIRYQDDYDMSPDEGFTLIELIGNNLQDADPQRTADFSNGCSVTVTPIMFGNFDNDGWFVDHEITFKYFYFMTQYFYQEFTIPSQYDTVTLNQYFAYGSTYPERDGNVLKAKEPYFYQHMYTEGCWPSYFAFGNTDSSFIYHGTGEIGCSTHNPMGCTGNFDGYVIRSTNYSPFVLIAPDKGKDKVITTTISFDPTDLIQVYAGPDKISYTKDDVFVYAPKFWDRLTVEVSSD